MHHHTAKGRLQILIRLIVGLWMEVRGEPDPNPGKLRPPDLRGELGALYRDNILRDPMDTKHMEVNRRQSRLRCGTKDDWGWAEDEGDQQEHGGRTYRGRRWSRLRRTPWCLTPLNGTRNIAERGQGSTECPDGKPPWRRDAKPAQQTEGSVGQIDS